MREQQTSVEWLEDQYIKHSGNLLEMRNAFAKAKEIEKEQIIEAFNQGNIYEGNFFDRVKITAEQYYNETFKSE